MKVKSQFGYCQEKYKLKQIILNEIKAMHSKALESYKQRRKNHCLQTLKDASNVTRPIDKQLFKIQTPSLCCNQFNQKIINQYKASQNNPNQKNIIKFKILKNQQKNEPKEQLAQQKITNQITTCNKSKDQGKITFQNVKVTQSIQLSQIQKKGVHSVESYDAMESSVEPVTKTIKQDSDDEPQLDSDSQITGIKPAINKNDSKQRKAKNEVNQIHQFRLQGSIDKSKPIGIVQPTLNLPNDKKSTTQQRYEQVDDDELFLN